MDPSFFFYIEDGRLCGVLVSHIDDFLHAGNDVFEAKILVPLVERFIAGRVEQKCFNYVGFGVRQEESCVVLSLGDYVSQFQPSLLKVPGPVERALDVKEQTEFRQLVGRLNWVAQGTRPDCFFEVINLSMKLKQATVGDLNLAKKAFRKLLVSGNSSIKYPALVGDMVFVVYTDAALGNLSDGVSSASGSLVFLADGYGNACPLSWRANKIRRVVRSTLGAETLALLEGVEEALYLRQLFREVFPGRKFPIDVYIDNKSAIEAVQSTKLVGDRRLRLDVGSLKQTLERDVRRIVWVPGDQQLANCLTKRGACSDSLLQVFQEGRFM